MEYREYEIVSALRPFVKVIWSMESKEASYVPPMRILPDSCVELVVHFKSPYTITFSNGKTEVQPQSFIVAQMKNFIEIQPAGKIGFISVRFTAQGAYHFSGQPMREIANGITDLRLIWNNLASEIEEQIAESKTTNERIGKIQSYLCIQLAKNSQADVTVDYCLKQIYSSKGLITIEDLADKAGLSNRQLVRKFNNSIGISPKEFAKIIKFISSLDYLRENRNDHLVEVANVCGYYDQAHFIRDFKEYAGLTPTQFIESENVVY